MANGSRDERSANEIATARRSEAVSTPDVARLLLLRGEDVKSVPLPASGRLAIGRSPEADVVMDDIEMSRVHLSVEVDGPSVRVRDEKSSNGTRLRGERLEPGKAVPLAPGDVVEAGGTRILLMPAGGLARRRRVWPHGYFELRVEEACAKSAGPFTLLRLRAPGVPGAFEEAVSPLLGPEDVLGAWSAGDYEVMLAGASDAEARRWLERLGEAVGSAPACGRATFPRDGRDPDALLAKSGEALEGAPAGERATVVVDPRMRELHAFLEKISAGDIPVLILGETGVGKEILVERLHALSKRRGGPLLKLNCGGLTESLLESELFGHEKGAFTGAIAAKPGLFETASGGSVFLDEVGEMPLSIQAKLLRVLEERKVRRVGGLEAKPVDVRFLAATNRDLERMVEQGSFRGDLFYRLNGVTVLVPPLRERTGEIVPLARAFVAEVARRHGEPAPAFAPEAEALLERYGWPGNIRELRNVVERAWLLAAGGPIGIAHLPVEKLASRLLPPTRPGEPDGDPKKRALLDALDACGGNQTRAAKSLGISRKTLMQRLDAFGITRPKKGAPGSK